MKKLEFVGFHATSQDNANKIKRDGFIVNKERDNEWLGHGIYLFMYNVDAQSWGKGVYYCKPNPVIIKCFLEVEKDKYLDLDNPEELNNYNNYYKVTLKRLSENGLTISFRDKHQAMCWGLNLFKKDQKIDLVKYTFPNNRTKNKMKYEYNQLGYKYNEVQMCVSRDELIVKKELCS